MPILPSPLMPDTPIASPNIRELINAVRDEVARGYDAGPGISIDDRVITAWPEGGFGSELVPMLVDDVSHNNYLRCRRMTEGVPGGDTITVLKPYELLHELWWYDEITALMTIGPQSIRVNNASPIPIVELWHVTPIYIAGITIIYAFQTYSDRTDVWGDKIEWIDVNIGARAWAMEC